MTTAYDALDRVATVTDPVGRAVHNTYTAAGELAVEYRGWVSGTACSLSGTLQECYATHHYTLNGKEDYVYDALGSSHLTTYTYDGFDRLTSTLFADASHEDLAYDANGNVTARITRAGDTLAYAYDRLDRLRVKTVPGATDAPAHTITTAYTLAGRTTSLTDSAGPALGYAFDTAGRATSESETTLGTARTVGWQLDAMGNHTRLTWPDSFAVNYAYDSLNRMSTATVNGGSLLAAYAYDPLSRRTSLTYNSGSSAMSYTWTDAGDLLTVGNDLAGSSNDVMFTNTYTNAHQLASESSSNSDYVWISPNTGSGDTYATVNTLNQYPSVNGGTLTWDNNGNLSTIAGATYFHDPENRLTCAVVPAATDTAYTYDPLGRRIAKAITAATAPLWGTLNWGAFTWTAAPTPTTTAFLHDGDNEIAEYDSSGSLIRRFVPGTEIDEPIAMITAAGATTFFHTDRKGSVIAMADTSGARVEGPYTYDAYGNCFVGATTTSCTTLATTTEPFRYTGQRYDPETGLYYYRARYYCVSIGRFCETDPAGYEPDINWYPYAYNDPTGRFECVQTGGHTLHCTGHGLADIAAMYAWKLAVESGIMSAPVMSENHGNESDGDSGSDNGTKTGTGTASEAGDAPPAATPDAGKPPATGATNTPKPRIKDKDRRAQQREERDRQRGGASEGPGTPGNNQDQNKGFNDATKELTPKEKDWLHKFISGQNLGYGEIKALADSIIMGRGAP